MLDDDSTKELQCFDDTVYFQRWRSGVVSVVVVGCILIEAGSCMRRRGPDMLFSTSSHQEVMNTSAVIIFIIMIKNQY